MKYWLIHAIVLLNAFYAPEATAHSGELSDNERSRLGQTRDSNKFFAEWSDADQTIRLGLFEGRKMNRKVLLQKYVGEIALADLVAWLDTPKHSALLIFHCMWGENPLYQKHVILSSAASMTQRENNTSGPSIITFIWKSGGLNYRANWQKAALKGEPLGNFLQLVADYYQGNASILVHSMGNRFLQGILRQMPTPEKAFNKIILFSADLPAQPNQDLLNCMAAAKGLYIFIHRNDRVLLISEKAHHCKRLGRTGLSATADFDNVTVVDMTNKISGIQNHGHFSKSWAKQRIRELLQ